MSGIVYALALFGCSDDATWCERLTAEAQTFNSRVQCEMTAAQVFETDVVRNADYPTVIAHCMNKGQWVKLDDKPVNLSGPTVLLASRDNDVADSRP